MMLNKSRAIGQTYYYFTLSHVTLTSAWRYAWNDLQHLLVGLILALLPWDYRGGPHSTPCGCLSCGRHFESTLEVPKTSMFVLVIWFNHFVLWNLQTYTYAQKMSIINHIYCHDYWHFIIFKQCFPNPTYTLHWDISPQLPCCSSPYIISFCKAISHIYLIRWKFLKCRCCIMSLLVRLNTIPLFLLLILQADELGNR